MIGSGRDIFIWFIGVVVGKSRSNIDFGRVIYGRIFKAGIRGERHIMVRVREQLYG